MKCELFDQGSGWEIELTPENVKDASRLARMGLDHMQAERAFTLSTTAHEETIKTWIWFNRKKDTHYNLYDIKTLKPTKRGAK